MLLTVFTPTYNRAYCLHQCYESLCSQTVKNFLWLIIDDGSIDNTEETVSNWINEGLISIKYIKQENQGMHGAHNTAFRLINTELCVCVDSDDFMPNDAVEIIESFWSINRSERVAGFIGLDAYKNGQIIGTKFPSTISKATLQEVYYKYKVRGDKKLVFRTDVVRQYPDYPLFNGEKFVPLGYKYLLIDQDYKMLILNKVLCIVEYMPDGSSLNIFKQYIKHPKGFSFYRKAQMRYGYSYKVKFKNAIHYVANSLSCNNYAFLSHSSSIFLTFLAIPFGLLLYCYIKFLNCVNR